MNTFIGYINYGCLGAEKRQVWTAYTEHANATCSDRVKITLPKDWSLLETCSGGITVLAPWGIEFQLWEVLAGNEQPYFVAYDKDGKMNRVKLKYREL